MFNIAIIWWSEMNGTIPKSESLTVEFKSDRKRMSDGELVEALVCLANTNGGELWLGVEDDGQATGLHADRMVLLGLAGMVAARTSPALHVAVEALQVNSVLVAKIIVPQAQSEVATQSGVYVRRRIKHDGMPECVPMLPHERISRASSFGLVDVSAQPVAGCTLADFDPLERERLRQAVEAYAWVQLAPDLDVTLSIGLANAPPYATDLLVVRAESAMLRAKYLGRNRVALA